MNVLLERSSWYKRLGQAVVHTVYPNTCAVCGQRGTWLCDSCASHYLPLAPMLCCDRCGHPLGRACQCKHLHPAITRVRAATVYDGWPVNAIHLLKYESERDRADLLASMMVKPLRQLGEDVVLVPVPLHEHRQNGRGFNQATTIAEGIARLHPTLIVDALQRVRETPSQARSAREERLEHMHNAFALRPGFVIDPGQHYVIVDDVFTTGATTGACADALSLAGATQISVLTFAIDLQSRDLETYRRLATAAGIV